MIYLAIRNHVKDVTVSNTYIGDGEPRDPVEFTVRAGKPLMVALESNTDWTTTLIEREPS